jgi:Zn-dependent protease
MLSTSIRLPFRLLGIPVMLDLSFLLAVPLLGWIIAMQVSRLSAEHGLWLHEGMLPYLLGLLITLGLFLSVVIHELGHSIVARLYGVEVRSITLWLLGGMAQFDQMPRQRGAEAVVAVAGPVTSLLVAAGLFFVAAAVPWHYTAARFSLTYLWQMNLVLAIFNMLPALPLDGGRVMRSLLALRFSHLGATRFTAVVSKMLALALGVLGLLYAPFLILIAVFVWWAVNQEMRQSFITEALDGVRVQELMTPQQAIPAEVLPEPQDTMIGERETANEAFLRMRQNNTPRLFVTDAAGRVVGIITRTDLAHAIESQLLRMDGSQPA